MDDDDLIRQLRERATYWRSRNQPAHAHLLTSAADRIEKLTRAGAVSLKRRVTNGKRQVMLGGVWYPDDD